MRKNSILPIILIAFIGLATQLLYRDPAIVSSAGIVQTAASKHYIDTTIEQAFKQKRSEVQVTGSGTVITILSDDLKGSRHQRFILELETGLTVLVAHNIDLAPRIEKLSVGDTVRYYGQYEWNDKGGVLHWTHHDPNQKHYHGWLRHNGKTYQ
ncbi:DUF3465 domain-containing protein [Alginatibacterium sediminis]|uniref:DUF3465 domain-containing protein n=1 Tax=Alginatibacterium sediminis TaxID=2164068 RepID=A0A420ED99_9ALTE|nr:DUF3465 domain-containing protein [Alginatibacterium sediminis]RKF18646.1 DUF3465 domain-containing protein [Alginatibacterium sediminis]